MIEKIISGGQTGVDRAALDIAITLNLSFGGWCPKGRIDEQGFIPEKYAELTEIVGEFHNEKENYDTRTKLNIQDSDGTLIITPITPLPAEVRDGTLLTIKEVITQNKPYIILTLSSSNDDNLTKLLAWYKEFDIHIINIAGPRESCCTGIYNASYELLTTLLPELCSSPSLSL